MSLHVLSWSTNEIKWSAMWLPWLVLWVGPVAVGPASCSGGVGLSVEGVEPVSSEVLGSCASGTVCSVSDWLSVAQINKYIIMIKLKLTSWGLDMDGEGRWSGPRTGQGRRRTRCGTRTRQRQQKTLKDQMWPEDLTETAKDWKWPATTRCFSGSMLTTTKTENTEISSILSCWNTVSLFTNH